jgi:hypothetical protein
VTHREILHRYRRSVRGNRSRSPWYEATHSGQAEAARPGPAWELVWSAGCWHVNLAGLAFAVTKQPWLRSVVLGAESALL